MRSITEEIGLFFFFPKSRGNDNNKSDLSPFSSSIVPRLSFVKEMNSKKSKPL